MIIKDTRISIGWPCLLSQLLDDDKPKGLLSWLGEPIKYEKSFATTGQAFGDLLCTVPWETKTEMKGSDSFWRLLLRSQSTLEIELKDVEPSTARVHHVPFRVRLDNLIADSITGVTGWIEAFLYSFGATIFVHIGVTGNLSVEEITVLVKRLREDNIWRIKLSPGQNIVADSNRPLNEIAFENLTKVAHLSINQDPSRLSSFAITTIVQADGFLHVQRIKPGSIEHRLLHNLTTQDELKGADLPVPVSNLIPQSLNAARSSFLYGTQRERAFWAPTKFAMSEKPGSMAAASSRDSALSEVHRFLCLELMQTEMLCLMAGDWYEKKQLGVERSMALSRDLGEWSRSAQRILVKLYRSNITIPRSSESARRFIQEGNYLRFVNALRKEFGREELESPDAS
jgi:hypothetical protein